MLHDILSHMYIIEIVRASLALASYAKTYPKSLQRLIYCMQSWKLLMELIFKTFEDPMTFQNFWLN